MNADVTKCGGIWLAFQLLSVSSRLEFKQGGQL